MKKFILCLLCVMGSEMYAQETFEVNGIVYKEDLSQKDKMCVIVQRKIIDDPSGYPVQSYYSGKVIVPSQVEHDLDNYEVTGISKWAFWICKEMTSLTINEGIKRLYPFTIWGENMTTLTLPNSLERIDDEAINCSPGVLHRVTFGKGLKYIGQRNFFGQLDEVVFTQDSPQFDCPEFLQRTYEDRNTIIIIPKGSTENYEKAWGKLNFKEQ